jgi:putative copper export protein
MGSTHDRAGRGGSPPWRRPDASSASVIASAVALATLAWTGHGAMDEGAKGWAHLLADILHLLAAGAWSGRCLALSCLWLALPAGRRAHLTLTHRVLHGFGLSVRSWSAPLSLPASSIHGC